MTMTSASLNASPRVRWKWCGSPGGRRPRPEPLKYAGMSSSRTRRSASSCPREVHTWVPSRIGRPFALDEEVGEALDVGRVADRLQRRPVAPRLGDDGGVGRHLAVEHVARDLEVARPGRAREALARRHRHHVRDALGRRHRCRELGDGGRDVDVREVLQRAHLVLGEGALPADMEHRALGAKRGRDAGHRVGEAGPRRRHHAAEAPGLARVAVRGMGRDLLVADVDDADPLVDAPVVDVDDVPAAEGEDGVHPFAPEGARDEVAARYDVAAPVLSGEGVGGGVLRHGGCVGGGCGGGCGHGALLVLNPVVGSGLSPYLRVSGLRVRPPVSPASPRAPPRAPRDRGCAGGRGARRARCRALRGPR